MGKQLYTLQYPVDKLDYMYVYKGSEFKMPVCTKI